MKLQYRHITRVAFLAVVLVAVTACGGGGSTSTPTLATYSVGGTVAGLDTGQSVSLQDNGGDNLTVSANGPFTFRAKVTSGSAYAVTVLTQPSGKFCAATDGSGTASANVTGVAVACAVPFTVRGTVSGLVGQGFELQVVRPTRGGWYGPRYVIVEALGVSGNGDFIFPTPVAFNGFSVLIAQQPQSPTQRCVVSSFAIDAPTSVANMSVSCEEFSYVTNAGDNTISAFSIDATTGAIASVGAAATAGLSPYAIAGTSDRGFLYVVNSGSNDVSAFAVDPRSGALTTVPGSPFAAGTNPKALALHSVPGSLLYVANSGSDDLSIYGIESNGALTPVSELYGGSRATGAGPSAIAIDPSGQFLYTANTGGSNDISAYQTEGFTSVAGSPFPSGSTVSSLAFGGVGGEFLYAANASGSTASLYGFSVQPFGYITNQQTTTVDPTSGALTSLPGFPYALPACNYIVADRTGAYLYANAGTNVLGYSIDAQTGALNPLPGFPVSAGVNSTSMSIDPTNQFLYVTNRSAGTVTSFELNATTGALTPMLGSPFAVGNSADYIATF